ARWPAWSSCGQEMVFADGPVSSSVDGGKNLWVKLPEGLFQITGFTGADSNGFPHGALWSPREDALVGAGNVVYTNGLWLIPLTEDGTDCEGSPILLADSAAGQVDFAGSVLAPSSPQSGLKPALFIQLSPELVTVLWNWAYDGFTLEFTTDLGPAG